MSKSLHQLYDEWIAKQKETQEIKLPSYSIEKAAYRNARRRCKDPQNVSYPSYGGRGIKFLYTSFKQFIQDVGPKPSKELSLDRKDNNGHYEVGNCRWATRKEQLENSRSKYFGTRNIPL